MRIDFSKMRRSDWIFAVVQFCSCILAMVWWFGLPAPGYAIAVTAVLAGSLSIHNEMRSWQKASWMLLIGMFVVLEFRAIHQDRVDSETKHSLERLDEQAAFQTVISQAKINFDASIKKSDTIRSEQGASFQSILGEEKSLLQLSSAQFKETQNELTGGDTYPYIMPVTVLDQKDAVLAVITSGQYVLTDVSVVIYELPIKNEGGLSHIRSIIDDSLPREVFNSVAPSQGTFLRYHPKLSLYLISSYKFAISARNGALGETLDILHSDEKHIWEYRLRVAKSVKRDSEKVLKDVGWTPIAVAPTH